MQQLESSILEELERLRCSYHHEMIEAECIEDCEAINLFREKIGPFKKNLTYKLPFWKIRPFIEKNYLRLPSKSQINSAFIQKLADSELEEIRLVKQKNNLFLELREASCFIPNLIKNKKLPKDEMEKYQDRFDILFNQRISKILQLASGNPSSEILDRLTSAERIIYKRLKNIINQYREFFSY
jgi:hypothetical protein